MAERSRLDRYWRLDDYARLSTKTLKHRVQKAGYPVTTSPSRSTLVDRLERSACGALVYDRCSTKELQRFLLARGLRIRDKREVAFRALRSADDQACFPKFMDLPPELRNRVYDFYFAALPEKIRPGVQAPITRTSRHIRGETLPIFYGTISFELRFFYRFRAFRGDTIRPINDVTLFLGQMLNLSLCFLRKVQIVLVYDRGADDEGESPEPPALTLDIERKSTGTDCTVTSSLFPGRMTPLSKANFANFCLCLADGLGWRLGRIYDQGKNNTP